MTREEAVRALVQFDRPLEALRTCLAGFPYDWDGPRLATLQRDDVSKVLTRWQAGDLTDEEVGEWAALVEMRDDVDQADAEVEDAIFNMANPVLQGPLQNVAPGLMQRLKA